MATSIASGQQSSVPSRARSVVRWLLAVGGGFLVLGLALAAATMPAPKDSVDAGPRRLHTVARGELVVSVTEQGTLESSDNTEVKCRVRGNNTIIWVVESGTIVQEGDELVRLDTLLIEEEISERTKFAHLARSTAERSRADVARAKLAISEYLEGRYVSDLATLEKDLAIFESNLRTAKNMFEHAKMMSESGYVSELQVEEREFAVTRATLDVEVKKTEIDVLKRFTKEEQLATLRGDLNAAKATHAADVERVYADEKRLQRAEEELELCAIRAEKSGLVIYPTGQRWKETPDIEEGATVHKDQILLLMPDLAKMQVKVGIHESIVDRVREGLSAMVTLPEHKLEGRVSEVSPVTRPAGWWTGNVVKYDTIVELPATDGLKPGMTAEVEVILARHEDVLLIPAAAVLETERGYACWIDNGQQPQRRAIQLGDSSDMFLVVESGLEEGEQVILNPLAYVKEAQLEAERSLIEGQRSNDKASRLESL